MEEQAAESGTKGAPRRNRQRGKGRGRGGTSGREQNTNQNNNSDGDSNVKQHDTAGTATQHNDRINSNKKKSAAGEGGKGRKIAPALNKADSHNQSQEIAAGNETTRGKPNDNFKKKGNQVQASVSAPEYAKSNAKESQENNSNRNRDNQKKRNNSNRQGKGKQKSSNYNSQVKYPPHWSLEKCMRLYVDKDPSIIRGKLRALPSKDGMAFCACDRGSLKRDVLLETALERNRGMNGDTVFVELLLPTAEENEQETVHDLLAQKEFSQLGIHDTPGKDVTEDDGEGEMWQDDAVQMDLWNPVVPILRRINSPQTADSAASEQHSTPQRRGRVVYVCPPIIPKDSPEGTTAKRVMVGTLKTLQSGTCLFTPNDKVLPQFKCETNLLRQQQQHEGNRKLQVTDSSDLYKAEYNYHTWGETHSWPPCVNVTRLGDACSIEDQIQGLLIENKVDHGEFSPEVLKNVENAVQSGVYLMTSQENGTDVEKSPQLGWKPTPEMYEGRRDYRSERIFTIDPTTAKDLDDALHIKKLPNGQVEIGVHIADVSAFVTPGSDVDREALRRATTVYLVDRTIPMLPRPLCEVACSLNENVERLAFSCVWRMNTDGTLGGRKGIEEKGQEVWYGRTVIKSCARLDYSTAQLIIENKVANGESEMDDELWPKSRRPTGGHTVDEVAADVRLMHQVAMARRRLRFSNGALALHGVKLAFVLDEDRSTPLQFFAYPIKDSNRLVEEYMLLANYLVAQRLITHCGDRAVLRRHPPPLNQGILKLVDIAKVMFNFDIDASSSASLHDSLVRFGRQCDDELILKCVTQMLTTPMQNADYFAAGSFEKEEWRHFALNIPYYTHFTSPIRRYADILVHRLLQATIDGEDAVDKFPLDPLALNDQCEHCNEKRLASKMAQERCDVVFLALYLRRYPMKSELGVVMSLGSKAITVFVPSIGLNAMLFLEEHKDWLEYAAHGEEPDRRLVLTRKEGKQMTCGSWRRLEVTTFTKLLVSCLYKDKPRVDVKLQLEGPALS